MEVQNLPLVQDPENETLTGLEDQELDRIAFELWRRGSLPELADAGDEDVEEVAGHASLL
jgi:hypothetical protein